MDNIVLKALSGVRHYILKVESRLYWDNSPSYEDIIKEMKLKNARLSQERDDAMAADPSIKPAEFHFK